VTWSVRRLCSISPSFTSRCQICDWSNICWIAVKEGDISAEKCGFSIATERILVRSQMWEWQVKEGLKLHNLCTDHVTIRSELRYLIGAKIVDLKCLVFGENQLQWSGSGSEPVPEPNRKFGPVANTTVGCVPAWFKRHFVVEDGESSINGLLALLQTFVTGTICQTAGMVILEERHQPLMQPLYKGSYCSTHLFGIRTTYIVPTRAIHGAVHVLLLTPLPDNSRLNLSNGIDMNAFNLFYM
jgi:hypothetical protein